MSMWL